MKIKRSYADLQPRSPSSDGEECAHKRHRICRETTGTSAAVLKGEPSRKRQAASIPSLPYELWQQILKSADLDLNDLVSGKRVCRTWNKILSTNDDPRWIRACLGSGSHPGGVLSLFATPSLSRPAVATRCTSTAQTFSPSKPAHMSLRSLIFPSFETDSDETASTYLLFHPRRGKMYDLTRTRRFPYTDETQFSEYAIATINAEQSFLTKCMGKAGLLTKLRNIEKDINEEAFPLASDLLDEVSWPPAKASSILHESSPAQTLLALNSGRIPCRERRPAHHAGDLRSALVCASHVLERASDPCGFNVFGVFSETDAMPVNPIGEEESLRQGRSLVLRVADLLESPQERSVALLDILTHLFEFHPSTGPAVSTLMAEFLADGTSLSDNMIARVQRGVAAWPYVFPNLHPILRSDARVILSALNSRAAITYDIAWPRLINRNTHGMNELLSLVPLNWQTIQNFLAYTVDILTWNRCPDLMSRDKHEMKTLFVTIQPAIARLSRDLIAQLKSIFIAHGDSLINIAAALDSASRNTIESDRESESESEMERETLISTRAFQALGSVVFSMERILSSLPKNQGVAELQAWQDMLNEYCPTPWREVILPPQSGAI